MKITKQEVFDLITAERNRQDAEWGTLEEKKKPLVGYLLIIRKELQEAEDGWMENLAGKHSALSELVQVAATAVAALEQYGAEGNPL